MNRAPAIAVAALSLLAGAISALRAVRTAAGDDGWTGVVLASAAAALALAAAATAFRSLRLAAPPLAAALLLELLVLGRYRVAPPQLINAIPLMFALAVALFYGLSSSERPRPPGSRTRTVATIVALVAMVPIGIAYLVSGLVAPWPDVLGAYALFALLLAGAVFLASRRSWWVVAVPIVSAALWPLMLWAGETYLDWSP